MSEQPLPLNREHFGANEVIFRAGDAADGAYVIESGSVEILTGPEGEYRRINVLGPGTMIGEIALLDGKPRSATVRTLVPTQVVRIYRNHVQGVLSQADPLLQYLVGVLLERIRVANLGTAPGAPAEVGGALPTTIASAADSQALQGQVMRSLALAQSLSDALDAWELELAYQPLVLLESRQLVGYEALVRWRHAQLGMIRPDEFIPLAEKTDLIHRVGSFVLAQAVADWKQLGPLCKRSANHPPFMSINLSAPEVCRPGLVAEVQQALQDAGMDPAELHIELTETSLVGNKALVGDVMQRLLSMGVSLALDDFGKGFSGMDYLQSLPFSCIKIDKSFVDGVLVSERSLTIVRSAIALARTLGMTTVAEGIEDEATARALQAEGCIYGQGYFFAKPMPPEAVQAWAQQRA